MNGREAAFAARERIRSLLKPTGLGDKIAAVAQPIARAIDKLAGTNIANCKGCKKRRETLNNLRLTPTRK